MTPDDLNALVRVLRSQYDQERYRLQPLLSSEARLRSALASLDRHDRSAQYETEDLSRIRAFGGDVLWASWLGRQRRDLNIQLARVLAEKSEQFAQLKKLYAKVLAAESLRDRARDDAQLCARRQLEADQMDILLSLR